MAGSPSKPLRPFEGATYRLSSGSLEMLHDWLEKECPQGLQLTADYTVSDLVSDLGNILGGMWSDGIDAMGDDA
jgi:hypothetical protein